MLSFKSEAFNVVSFIFHAFIKICSKITFLFVQIQGTFFPYVYSQFVVPLTIIMCTKNEINKIRGKTCD